MSARDMHKYDLTVNGFCVSASFTDEEISGILDHVLDTLIAIHLEKTEKSRTVAFFAGPPGAGKSTLSMALEKRARERKLMLQVQSLGLDGFHLKSSILKTRKTVKDGREISLSDIKGAPETFDAGGFLKAAEQAKFSFEAPWPVYDRRLHDVIDGALKVTGDILFIEGNWLLLPGLWQEARKLSDRNYAVLAPDPLLKERLIQRKQMGGKTPAEALLWYENVDEPNVRLYHALSAAPDETFMQNEYGRWKKI